LPRFWPNRQSDFRVTLACSRRDSSGDAPLKSPFINLPSPFSNFAIRCASCDLFYQRIVTILLARFGSIVDHHNMFTSSNDLSSLCRHFRVRVAALPKEKESLSAVQMSLSIDNSLMLEPHETFYGSAMDFRSLSSDMEDIAAIAR
jgi:hypothetical protein